MFHKTLIIGFVFEKKDITYFFPSDEVDYGETSPSEINILFPYSVREQSRQQDLGSQKFFWRGFRQMRWVQVGSKSYPFRRAG